jgi:hypothetical protein
MSMLPFGDLHSLSTLWVTLPSHEAIFFQEKDKIGRMDG